jgi:hypothetical protein
LILIGLYLDAWLLALLGLFNLWGVRLPFKLAKIANEVRQSATYQQSLEGIDKRDIDSHTVPPNTAKVVIDNVYEYFPPPVEISTIARYTKEIWERICFHPSGIFSTIALLIVYLFVFCLPFIALVGSMIVSVSERSGFAETKIVKYQKPDGTEGLKEQIYFFKKLDSEIEIDPQRYLYHGKDISYRYGDANSISAEGTWREGMLDGQWKVYNTQGDLIRVTVYDKGNFVSRRVKANGQWVEKKFEDLPFLTRWRLNRYKKKPRGATQK